MSIRTRRFIVDYRVPLVVLAGLWLIFALTTNTFRSDAGLYSVLLGFGLLGIVTAGMAVTMVAGELDLSIAALAGVGGAVAVRCSVLGLWPAVLIAAVATCAFGALQGWLIARLRISSLIITVGSLILVGGLTFVITDGTPIGVHDTRMALPLYERWWVFSPDILVGIAILAAIALFLATTRFGRELYAIGGARQEALAAGVARLRPLIIAFAISGFCGGLAGALASMKAGSAQPAPFGNLLLSAVLAALIGGISLYGGRGTMLHVTLGVAIISLLSAGLNLFGAKDYAIQLITGLLLLVVVFIEFFASRRIDFRSRRRRPAPAIAG